MKADSIAILNELKKIEDILRNAFGEVGDIESFYADTITVAGSAITTLEITIGEGWKVLMKKIYVDVVADCTYKWYWLGDEHIGNEFNFTKGIWFRQNEKIILKITNTGTSKDVDVFVEGIGRRIVW